ncbi:MAG: energy-coupling factor transporter transmembrane protein EcfT [Clostridiales bacterium]|nr:energy-coupling factor transporter transmembrane protein EcfT [Clostridiales bacterium]
MKKAPDPRVTFAISACLSLLAVFARDIYLMGWLLSLALLAALLLRVELLRVFRKLKRLWQVMLMVVLLQSVFSPSGVVWLQIGRLVLLSSGGVMLGLLVLGRLTILILGGALFTLYSTRELVQGMIQLRLPYEIAFMISVGIRFVPLMGEALRDSLTALALRGVVIKELKWRKRINVYTYILMPAVAGALHNASALSMSMELRGFGAYAKRTSWFVLRFSWRDWVLLAVVAVIGVATGAGMMF